jgi:hypothetical protein
MNTKITCRNKLQQHVYSLTSKLTLIETHIIILTGNGRDCSFLSGVSKICTITPVFDIQRRHILCRLGLLIFVKHISNTDKTTVLFIQFRSIFAMSLYCTGWPQRNVLGIKLLWNYRISFHFQVVTFPGRGSTGRVK